MTEQQSFGFVVVNTANLSNIRFLLVQGYDRRWGFPKGGSESEDASELETALRELYEETNMQASHIKVIDTPSFIENYIIKKKKRPNISKTVKYFLAETNSFDTQRQNSEIRDMGWFTFDGALNKLNKKKSKILREAMAIIKKLSK